MPGQTPTQKHPHPNRHRRALRSALLLAGAGILLWVIGLVTLMLGTESGYLVSLMVVGITVLLLSPVWYFTYMEILEPDLYAPDAPHEDQKTVEDKERRP